MIALCAIGRLENLYAREWVDYHLALGFDRIVIYDNNRDGEEFFEDVLEEPVREGFVEIINYRGRENAHIDAYNDCYKRYGQACEWIAFFDFDEFLTIVDGSDIHTFMQRYDGADCLLVNWKIYTDNGLLRYDPRPLAERFTQPMPEDRCVSYDFPEDCHVKSIVRGGWQSLRWRRNPHVPTDPLLRCVSASNQPRLQRPFQTRDFNVAYLRHYTTKTIEEWMTCKVQRGFPSSEKLNRSWRERHLKQFFAINEWTPEKQRLIEATIDDHVTTNS